MSYTADDLSTLKAAATNAVRSYLRAARETTETGIRLGLLADSACDGLLVGANFTAAPLGFASRFPAVLVRAQDGHTVQDFVVTPSFNGGAQPATGASWIPSSWGIMEDARHMVGA